MNMNHTPLHDIHTSLNAKMGEFAGYDMPLYYGEGVIKEHEWVRESAGLFDVSHMGQIMVTGPDGAAFWEKVTPSPFLKNTDGMARYTVLTNEKGGIIDDLIVTRLEANKWVAVLNAGRKYLDLEWLKTNLPMDLTLAYMEDHALLALQGPRAEAAIRAALGIDCGDLAYMHARYEHFDGAKILISRVGYTGEDGFEISVHESNAVALWNKLAAHDDVKPAGLAARDSLRLEMGYCLYGHDIDENSTPVEAALDWVIGKERDGYTGAGVIAEQREKGAARRRVGIRLLDKGVAREGAAILNEKGEKIGALTSGGFSPTLKQSIGQGYVDIAFAKEGTKIAVNIRDRAAAAEIASLSFIAPKTKKAQVHADKTAVQ